MSVLLPSVALVGKQGSGKTTMAKLLVERGYLRHSWAEPVRTIFSMAYDTITPENYSEIKSKLYDTTTHTFDGGTKIVQRTGGELLQLIGTEAIRHQVDQQFWIKAGLRRIFRDQMVNDDTRFLNEAEALRGLGWVVVRVSAPDEVRRARIGGAFRPEGHSSETEQERIAEDYTLTNDERGSIDDVFSDLMMFLQSVDNSFTARAERAFADGPI